MAKNQELHDRLDEVREMLLFAPLGLLYEYEEVMPRLVRRGKSQVQLAKIIGKAASNRGHVERNISDAAEGVSDLLARGLLEVGQLFGLAPDTSPKKSATPNRDHVAEPDQVTDDGPASKKPSSPKSKSKKDGKKAAKPKAKAAKSKAAKSKSKGPKSKAKKAKPKAKKPATKKKLGPLPIAGYDDLTAREIMPLLSDLSASERTRVRKYESKNRARKTILAKLDTLEK